MDTPLGVKSRDFNLIFFSDGILLSIQVDRAENIRLISDGVSPERKRLVAGKGPR